jgi:phospholipase D1/2
LRVYYPKLPGTPHGLQVHCKLMIIDDALLMIGSANLSNRSLGLDTECNITIEASSGADDGARISAGIRSILARLLSEHLELDQAACSAQLQEHTPGQLIESRRGRDRCLEHLPESLPDPALDLGALGEWVVDPERPMAGETFIEGLFPVDLRHPFLRSSLASLVMLSPVLVMTAVYREHFAWFEWLAHTPDTDALLWLGFAVGCLTFVPLSLLLAAAAVLFDPGDAIVFGVSSALASSALAYGVGRSFRPWTLRSVRGRRARHLQRSAKVRAFRATVVARLLPIGNFTASNLLAGALGVPFARFLSGNLAGLTLGVATLVLFAKRVLAAFATPSALNVLACVGAGAAMIGLCYTVASLFERSVKREKALPPSAARPSSPGVARASVTPQVGAARASIEPDAPLEPLPAPASKAPPPSASKTDDA